MSTLLTLAFVVPWAAAVALAGLDGRRRTVGAAAVVALAAAAVMTAILTAHVLGEGPVQTVPGEWTEGLGISLRADPLGLLFALTSQLVLIGALTHEVLRGADERRFPALVLFMTAGLTGLFLTADVFNFYVFFELSMTAGYVLASYRVRTREAAPSLIFAVVNLLGSFLFLIGVAALYHVTGTLEMAAVAERLSGVEEAPVLMIAVAFFVAFGVKLGLFPFHFWLPVVYTRCTPPVAAILAGALANIGSYGLLRFGGTLFENEVETASTALVAIGSVSIVYGAVQAVSRRDAGEVLAYSTIGQAGYVIVALGIGGPVGYAAAVIYALVNALNKALLFMAGGLRGWLVPATYAIGALSVVGIPPAAGFLAKLAVFRTGIEADSIALVALLFLGGALSFVYMFQLYQHRFWAAPSTSAPSAAGLRVLVAGFALLVLALGLWPEPLVAGSEKAAAAALGGAGP